MATSIEDSFLILSSTDSSMDLFDEDILDQMNVRPIHLPNSVINPLKKKGLTSLDASSPLKEREDDGKLLRSAVANALGVDASELPQPLQSHDESNSAHSSSSDSQQSPDEGRLLRQGSASSASIYSPSVDSATCSKSTGDSIENQISETMASILDLESTSLPLDESFVDLGGNHRKARELRARCMDSGLAIKTKDIMNCKTIAELETYVMPLATPELLEDKFPTTTVGPLRLSSPEIPLFSSQRQTSQYRRPPAIPPKAAARYSAAQSHLKVRPSRRRYVQVEQVISLHNDISRACVLKPKAGPFEDQLVAFITLASCVVGEPDDCEAKLQNAYYIAQLPAVRKAVESRVLSSLAPRVWIVLEQMPIDGLGKINRRKLQTWIQNVNEELYRQILSVDSTGSPKQPTTVIERRIQKIASKILRVEQKNIDMNMPFLRLGGNESATAQFVAKCENQGIHLSTEDVVQTTSLSQLAALATSNILHSRKSAEAIVEVFELSPMQRLYFHTHMGSDNKQRRAGNSEYRYNKSVLFRIKQNVGIEDIQAAVEAIVGHHPMLRSRFQPDGNSWCQSIESDIPSSYHFTHHSGRTNAEVEEVIGSAQVMIDIEAGPVFAAHHFHIHDGSQMLYMLAHHLVVDLQSWRVIADDLEALLTSGCLVSGRSLSFKEWSLRHIHHIQGMEPVFNIPAEQYRYWGVEGASNTYGNTIATGFVLSAEATSALDASCLALRMDTIDIYMAALLLSFTQTFRDRPVPVLWSQESKRTILDTVSDVSKAVGWFTSLCPFAMDISATDDILTALNHVKDSRHASTEKGVLQFTGSLIDATSALSFSSSHCPFELMFTYSGPIRNVQNKDALLEQLPVPGKTLTSRTSDIGHNVGRISMFEVSVLANQGETKVEILYHRNSKHQEQIHDWICGYENILRQATNRLQLESPRLSLSDIPHMDITDEELSRLNTIILPRLNLNVSDIEAIYPATTIQQNILTHQSLISGSSKAQMTYDLDTYGKPVDISRICAAWLQVSEKHAALRTVFSKSVSKKGLYDQLILRSHSPSRLFLDCDSVEDAMVSFDNLPPLPLNEGTPWNRLVVCQVAGKTFLKLEISQAACDVASMTILFRELEQAYFYGQVAPVPEVSYPEYTQCLKVTACSIDFWREYLRGVQLCRFPTLISQRPTPDEWETTSIDLKISSGSLKTFAKDYKINISTVLQVAWGLLLRTYIGTENVCFGSRISGRDLPVDHMDDAIGSFSTVLTSRLTFPRGELIAQLLLNTERERRKVLDHQHVPVTRVEHELKTKGDHLFNTCLAFGYEYAPDDVSANIRCRHVRTEQASEYDINTDVYLHNGSITVDIGHRILTAEQATAMACAFGKAIEIIMAAPTRKIKDVDLFSIRDHNQILAWNSMPQVDVSKKHIHELIADQASLNPDIQAVCAWDGDLSYDDLHRSSTILAKHLIASGLKPRTPVPVIIDKSRWAVVAMLAVIHAGAILVPIDAEVTSTFAWVIKTVCPSLVLVSDHIHKHFEDLGTMVIIVDKTVAAMSAQVVDLTLPQPSLHDIACILFSFGSSKTPKGISYSHGALATACAGQGPTFLINPSSRVMQLSSYSVDTALSEVFTTLVNGGCVCIPSNSERIADFSGAARRMRVNWTYLTPTLSRKLDPESLSDLAVVCFRTRHLDSDVCAQWVGKAKVLLAYGSAEACPLGLSTAEVTHSKTSQCFGSPFCGNFWIVSSEDNNRLMPVGALGELVIGGPTLATRFDVNDTDVKSWVRKSTHRAQLLLEKPGSRLLKTGHYVRYREEGEIEFVSDDTEMIHINGRNFCHSDVEPKLRQCLGRGVDVVVETIAFNDPNSAPVLAAFVEIGEDLFKGSESLSRLSRITRERLYLSKQMANMVLRESLPSYMIPSAYIPVRRMPLTTSLEVNRLELQRMIAGLTRKQLLGLAEVLNPQEIQGNSFKPLPFTRVEHEMRALWAQVLGVEEDSIKASDGFLNLGGDVILAHDLIVECRERGISIAVVDVLRDVSLADLCRGVVAMEMPPANDQEARSAQQSPTNYFFDEAIAPQLKSNRSLIEDVAEASSLQTTFVESGTLQNHGNINYLTINITGSLDWNKLEDACFALTKAHPTLRTAFVSHGRQLYQTVLRSYHPEFLRSQCQSWRLGHLTAKLIKREQSEPVDFRRPITKFFYLEAGKSSVLVIRLSRAQYDDLSTPVLVQDLSRFYDYSCSDQIVRRPGLCEVVRAAQSTHSNGASEYWCALLAGATMTQIISQPSPASVNLNSTTLHQQLPTGPLQKLGIPFETILKGAWSVVLSNLSGTDDVVFGQLVDGKNLNLLAGEAISDVVGPVGNIIPVRTRLPDIPITPYEYFRYIQSQHVASVPFEHMQTSAIVQKCTPWPSWTRFSTVVYHRKQDKDAVLTDFTIGDARCKLDGVESSHQDSDIFIQSVMSGASNVEILLSFCEKRIPLSFAQEVLKMLCSVISHLTSAFVMEPMNLKGLSDNYTTSRIPLPTPKQELSLSSTVDSVDPDLARGVHTIISAAWDAILEAKSLKVPDIRSVPFYEIWGALIPAAELARYYTENVNITSGAERTAFTMEEIIDHPTMMQQYELIITKHYTPQLRRRQSPMLMGTQSVWGKSIRKLSGTSNPINAKSNGYHIRHNHKPKGSGGSTSMESMTMGSSQSDEEPKEDILLDYDALKMKAPVRERPHFPPPERFDSPSPTELEMKEVMDVNSNWLIAAEKDIQRDLETSKKELGLVRDTLDELEVNWATEKRSSPLFNDQMFLMKACQEYSGSRCHMLEERLRQVRLWSSTEQMGREIPDGLPDEYAVP
ncbi:hypothetical protein F4804DRAFT_331908 [Jackrogersella minutella]|nr:hypothetical protein F4804DRAFT_331908 [Jackrogersella minutella]